ncbi:helix-turn-helix domain-containing protein [Micromonospora sp. NPDC049366]|uniref:helix-turn-helix domain-containing protein n=1 Tax=Micromonospora sp. NPDC049366 TaxID=3364271 RepID=UPI0037B94C10
MPDITRRELTIQEACALLRCSRWTLRRVIETHLLRVVRVDGPGRDGAKRVPRETLVALVSSCTVEREDGGDDVALSTEEPDLDLMTFQEFAAKTGISKRVLDETARAKGITHIKVGKTRYLNRAMRSAFLSGNTVATKTDDDLAAVRARVARQQGRQRNSSARRA